MRITMEIEVTTNDGSSPLEEDVCEALRTAIDGTHLSWNDPSLGRMLLAKIKTIDVFRT